MTTRTLESIHEELVADIVSQAGDCDPKDVEFTHRIHTDDAGLTWLEFAYLGHGEPFPIYVRHSSFGAFQSCVDTSDFEYYTA